ncbi:MAG: ATP synthase subunit I [Eubacteriaceae bacterium]
MKMTNLSLETKIMIGGGIITIIMMLFGLLTENPLNFMLGVLFGGVFSILHFRLMQLTFQKAMAMPPAKAQKYVQTRYFLRFFITGVVIYIAIISPWLNIVGVILGLIAVKISLLINNFYSKKNISKIEM